MQTETIPAGFGTWARRAWLLPLTLSLFGCGGSSGESAQQATQASPSDTPNEASAPAPAPAQAASTPEALRGQWETVLSYVPAFYSGPFGGVAQGDGSIGITFYFSPDGHYRHVWDLAQAYFGGNCFRTAHWEETGTVSGTGTEFTFTPGKATYSLLDSCGQTQFLDPAPVTPASHSLTLDRDGSGWPLLRMGLPSGEIVLEKCRRCQ